MLISLFNKLRPPLLHGPISNTIWSVPIAHYCLHYQLCMMCMAKGIMVACLVNKSKPVC